MTLSRDNGGWPEPKNYDPRFAGVGVGKGIRLRREIPAIVSEEDLRAGVLIEKMVPRLQKLSLQGLEVVESLIDQLEGKEG